MTIWQEVSRAKAALLQIKFDVAVLDLKYALARYRWLEEKAGFRESQREMGG